VRVNPWRRESLLLLLLLLLLGPAGPAGPSLLLGLVTEGVRRFDKVW